MKEARISGISQGENLTFAQRLKNQVLMLDAKWRMKAGQDPRITIYLGIEDVAELEMDVNASGPMGAGLRCDIPSGEARFLGKRIVPVALPRYFAVEATFDL